MKKTVIAIASGLIITTAFVWANGAAFSQGYGMGKGMGRGMGQGYGMGMGRGMGGMMGNHQHGQGHQGNQVRHRLIRMGGGVPAPYSNARNPLKPNDENIKAGKALFGEQCASCHGTSGIGDGDAGRELSPKPANIAFIMDKWIATDPFLFWTMSEGGESLKTAMPAFKETLSEKQRWQIVHYLRTDLALEN